MMSPEMQALKFVEWMLGFVAQIDLAAARYGSSGQVEKIATVRMPVRSLDDVRHVMPWLKARNAAGWNIWARPSFTLGSHPILMLDDLQIVRATAIAGKYLGAIVETSPGNCQCWLVASQSLSREQRQDVLRRLIKLSGADAGAISEPRWGRLPGFQQKKPGKRGWTNLVLLSNPSQPLLDPNPYLLGYCLPPPRGGGGVASPRPDASAGRDESRREFAFACHALRSGMAEQDVERRVQAHVTETCRRKAPDYAARTVQAAMRSLQMNLK